MHRWTVSLAVLPILGDAPAALACSCIGYPSQAEADAAGERAYA